MRPKILYLMVIGLAIGSSFAACSSPPEATHDVSVVGKKVFPVPTEATFAFTQPYDFYSFTDEVVLAQAAVAQAATYAAASAPILNCSKPQSIGLANRQRVVSNEILIHILVAATAGHRLISLHIDPGLC